MRTEPTSRCEATVADVWSWLSEIPDPEIPVISIVDLGIVRDVAWVADELVVAITPTYSGCPATSVISLDIERTLHAHGIPRVRLERRLSPPWTTAWLSDGARIRLKNYGIAPPVEGHGAYCGRSADLVVTCPRCDSQKTEKISQFGSTPCKAAYRCTDCLEPFDYFKCI